ncbi:MAG: cytochrome c4 [Thermonema sp.]|uniref:bifunctional 3-deoxy-7-phosphoheptulonate synthase/chorismate mutase type II n=1 Tax=Thermonema sp. TaxID=2231181 RepID=UPI0021DC2444|nr:bifunctional 3-deoxy-7-phosphoheptulonate synthase/chorismate mutase type II [Thermonema sp.]GIV40300.1 MAG: cytochrome c4 [Thermonema sp.]
MSVQLDIADLQTWLPHQSPLVIAGPCSAETEEQLLETCLKLKETGVHALRAGIWKPRTRPGSFEGHGAKALPWVQAVKQATGLPFCIEVASPQHIELALKHEVDVLWIGARTTVNPFNVQDIADALRGVDVPVMIKNPVNPDLKLWLGAIERLHQAGIRKMAVIHRGFSTYEESKYRNPPMWQIPIELKRLLPNMPLICDPSHIAGRRDLLLRIVQKALDLNYEGIMIEVHRNPQEAWSDAAQQITPEALGEMLQRLELRHPNIEDPLDANILDTLRQKIDNIDHEIVELLAKRMNIVEQIGEYKKEKGITIFQLERWNQVFRTRSEWAQQHALNAELIAEIYKLIHVESIRIQTEVMQNQAQPKDQTQG